MLQNDLSVISQSNESVEEDQYIYVYGVPNTRIGSLLEKYEPMKNRTMEVAIMPERNACGVIGCREHLYAIGGMTDSETKTNSVDCFSLTKQTFCNIQNMNEVRECPLVASSVNEIVVCGGGGWESGEFLKTATVYNILGNCWKQMPDMHDKRYGGCLVWLNNGHLFAIGGSGLCSVETSFRPWWITEADKEEKKNNHWDLVASMHEERCFFGAIEYAGGILAVGGIQYTKLNSVEMFHPPDKECKLGQWTRVVNMTRKICIKSLVLYNKDVYAFGYKGEIEMLKINRKKFKNLLKAKSSSDKEIGTWTACQSLTNFCRVLGAFSTV